MGDPESPPPPRKGIPSNLIVMFKREGNGIAGRPEGRLVAIENLQSDQLGLVEVYVPVTSIETVRILFSVAESRG